MKLSAGEWIFNLGHSSKNPMGILRATHLQKTVDGSEIRRG